MLAEYYEPFHQMYSDVVASIMQNIMKMDGTEDTDSYQHLQQTIIEFGILLEEQYGLENSKILIRLEKCCELIYELCIAEAGKREILNELSTTFKKLEEDFAETVSLTDYHTSIVLIAKDEQRYIEEWLEYHLLVGISHFYIYDNGSKESFKDILQPYIDDGFITYHWFPGEVKQMEAYNHALKNHKLETKYMAFTDADEFLVPVQGDTIPNVIDDIIDTYENGKYKLNGHAGGIGVNWRNYGTSGYKKMQDGLLIASHIQRSEDKYASNVHIKTICNPRLVKEFKYTVHSPEYENGYYAISENGSLIPSAFFFDGHCEKIRINHYYMKSEEEFYEKWRRGFADLPGEYSDAQIKEKFDYFVEDCNRVEDTIMYRYVEKVENALKNKD